VKSYKKIILFQVELILIISLLIFNLKMEEVVILSPRSDNQALIDNDIYEFKQTFSKRSSPINAFANLINTPHSTPVLSAMDEAPPDVGSATSSLKYKDSYLIAIIGDSMVETMGDSLEYLQGHIEKKYPGVNFVYYNYGVGGENVESALGRFDKEFNFGNKHYGSLSTLKPDILIVGSFAYNPFSNHDRKKHYSLLSDLVVRAKEASDNVYILAEIAPLENGFGKGIGGVNWPEELADKHTVSIIEQLENAVVLADTIGVGLINVYSSSRVGGGKYGDVVYVNGHDGIHPSVEGHTFTARLIAKEIDLK
jgi:hypothetical protein